MILLTAVLASLLPTALSCAHHLPRQASNSTFPFVQAGPDTPTDPATTGYFVNHFALNTANLTLSLDFYTRVFGMRHMFTYHMTPHFSVTYLAHGQGGRNGSAYQSTAELLRNKQNSAGMIELLYLNRTSIGGEPIPGPDKRTSTLSHVGMIVPDPLATQARLEEFGVTIYKKVGEQMPDGGPIGTPSGYGDASGLSEEAFKAIQKQMSELNQLNIFAADPDGNLLEILPFNEPPLFG